MPSTVHNDSSAHSQDLPCGRTICARDLKRLQALASQCGVRGRIAGRSLRAGGATDYFAVDAGVQFVKHQGGWKSDAYLRYDRPTPAQRVFLATKYAKRLRSLLHAPRDSPA